MAATNPERGVALVTGTSTGIGPVLCEHLLASGHEVLALARRETPISHPRLKSIRVDLADRAATAQVARELAAQHAITTVVHNAGIIRPALLAEVKLEDLSTLTELHLACAITLVQAALPAMRKQRFGRIVLLSSRGALGLATRSAYSATKAGMIGMARTWALELAPHGITVNVVAPGPIESTEMFHEVLPKGDPRIDALARAIPLRRLGTPEDVAHAVMYFASPAAGFVTGQTLYVCGGASVGTITI